MRLGFLVCILSLTFIPAVQAQDDAPPNSEANVHADRVQFIEDDENGKLRIVIDGKDVALIDADGLHIAGDIAYSGTITDLGAAAITEAKDAP